MTSSDLPRDAPNFADSKFGPEAVNRLRFAFERSRHPMLLVDDQRRWVTANTPARELLGIARDDVPWCTMDDFMRPEERGEVFDTHWKTFLSEGAAEGWYPLQIPDQGLIPVEFSATANVLPARHLSVFIPSEGSNVEQAKRLSKPEGKWTPIVTEAGDHSQLSDREREIMTLVSSGLQGGEIADRLFLSPETVKSHVRNTMVKLGAHTRAHAVTIALVTGQISWQG